MSDGESTVKERLARLEQSMETVIEQNKCILGKINDIRPKVLENSWWIDKLKWAFVMIAVCGVGLGIVKFITYLY